MDLHNLDGGILRKITVRRKWQAVGVVVLAVLALGVAGLALMRPLDTPVAVASTSPKPSPSPQPTRPFAVFLGDSFTAGNDDTPGAAKFGFVDRAAVELGWDKTNLAQGGTGYVNPGAAGSTNYAGTSWRVVDLAPDIILIGGGINDAKYPAAQVAAAADALYKDLKARLPKAKIVVMGPVAPGGVAGEYKTSVPVRDALKATAEANGIPFIDPIAEDWMPTKAGFVGPSNFHPNEAGHKMLGGKLAADLKALHFS